MATNADWSRLALAPGASSTAISTAREGWGSGGRSPPGQAVADPALLVGGLSAGRRPAPSISPERRERSDRVRAMDSRHQDAAGFGQLQDPLAGAFGLGAVVGMGGAEQRAEPPLHLIGVRPQVGPEAHHLERPAL